MNIVKVLKNIISKDGEHEGEESEFEPTPEQKALEAMQDKLESDLETEIARRRRRGLQR